VFSLDNSRAGPDARLPAFKRLFPRIAGAINERDYLTLVWVWDILPGALNPGGSEPFGVVFVAPSFLAVRKELIMDLGSTVIGMLKSPFRTASEFTVGTIRMSKI